MCSSEGARILGSSGRGLINVDFTWGGVSGATDKLPVNRENLNNFNYFTPYAAVMID